METPRSLAGTPTGPAARFPMEPLRRQQLLLLCFYVSSYAADTKRFSWAVANIDAGDVFSPS